MISMLVLRKSCSATSKMRSISGLEVTHSNKHSSVCTSMMMMEKPEAMANKLGPQHQQLHEQLHSAVRTLSNPAASSITALASLSLSQLRQLLRHCLTRIISMSGGFISIIILKSSKRFVVCMCNRVDMCL